MSNAIPFNAESIAALSLHKGDLGFKTQLAQTVYRIELVSSWGIQPGDRILEIGCGQGDATTILATAVGPTGHVTAVDPARLDYGSPFTLGQSQSHISAGELGSRITWVQKNPLDLFHTPPTSSDKPYDLIVFVQSTWYFSSPSSLAETVSALTPHTKRLAIAEYSLRSSIPLSAPHVLAVLTQASLEVRKPLSESNVRTVVGPRALTDLAKAAGWVLEHEAFVVPDVGQKEGFWETSHVTSEGYLKEIESIVVDEREKSLVLALRDATVVSAAQVGGPRNVRAMDVWSAVFKLSQ